MVDKLKSLAKVYKYIETSIGWKKFIVYSFFCIFCLYIISFRENVIYYSLEYIESIQEKKHSEKLEKRDELLIELGSVLRELRAETNADRILYFEYHNSKENLVKIPFKYLDLVSMYTKYGVTGIEEFKEYHDISSGLISDLYKDLGKYDIIINKDISFRNKYPNEYGFFMKDGSVIQVFINLSGINTPIGFIVLEWIENEPLNYEEIRKISYKYSSRINALVIKNSGL